MTHSSVPPSPDAAAASSPPADSEALVGLVTTYQPRLFGYILSLVGDPAAAEDVLQETNMVIWRKAGEFEPGTNFKAWAFRIAHFQILAHRQRELRSRVVFDDELVESLANESHDFHGGDDFDRRQDALEVCLEKLSDRQRDAILGKYFHGLTLNDLAVKLRIAANAVSQLLFRARQNLIECVEQQLSQQEQRIAPASAHPEPLA